MRRSALTLIGFIVIAAPCYAQAPATMSCSGRDGRDVSGVKVTNGVLAKAAVDASGKPVIEYDARPVPGIGAQQQLFVYAHECGHHALGHDVRAQGFTAAQEHDADCYGIRALMSRFGVTANDVPTLQRDMQEIGPGDARRLPWMKRTYDLASCLPRAPADDTASAAPKNPADACVAHEDASNDILTKSRDGRSITASYSAGNRCDHDIACTFTIEIGTLPDEDADAGNFSRFHPLKTRTEQHTLKSGSNAEFRFEEMVESVAAGESVDYRMRASCR